MKVFALSKLPLLLPVILLGLASLTNGYTQVDDEATTKLLNSPEKIVEQVHRLGNALTVIQNQQLETLKKLEEITNLRESLEEIFADHQTTIQQMAEEEKGIRQSLAEVYERYKEYQQRQRWAQYQHHQYRQQQQQKREQERREQERRVEQQERRKKSQMDELLNNYNLQQVRIECEPSSEQPYVYESCEIVTAADAAAASPSLSDEDDTPAIVSESTSSSYHAHQVRLLPEISTQDLVKALQSRMPRDWQRGQRK